MPLVRRRHWLEEEEVCPAFISPLSSPLYVTTKLDGRGTPAGREVDEVRVSAEGTGTAGGGCRGAVGIANGRPEYGDVTL